MMIENSEMGRLLEMMDEGEAWRARESARIMGQRERESCRAENTCGPRIPGNSAYARKVF